MTVRELIATLSKLDPDAEVGIHSNSEEYDVDWIDGASTVYSNTVILSTDLDADPEEQDMDSDEIAAALKAMQDGETEEFGHCSVERKDANNFAVWIDGYRHDCYSLDMAVDTITN